MYNYRIKSPQPPSFNSLLIKPLIVGLILIALITLYFFYKNDRELFMTQKKREQLEKQVLQEEYVEVDLASPKEVYLAIGSDKIQLVDIREPEEFAIKRIESSTNIPFSSLDLDIDLIDKDSQVIIIDREDTPHGRIFTDHLKNENVKVKYLDGGIVNYANHDYPLLTTGNPTNPQDLLKVASITTDQLLQMVFDGESIALIDTRSAEDFNQSHIKGAINIPLEDIEKSQHDLPSKNLVLYDSATMRSFRAAVRLHDLGFYTVYNCLDDYETLNRRLQEELEKNKKEKEQSSPTQGQSSN